MKHWGDELLRMQEIDRRHDVERRLRDKEEECGALRSRIGEWIDYSEKLKVERNALHKALYELRLRRYGTEEDDVEELKRNLALYEEDNKRLDGLVKYLSKENAQVWRLYHRSVEELRKKVK